MIQGSSGEPVALVILRSPAGPPSDADLTVAGAGRAFPTDAAVAAVGSELAAAGFVVGPTVGISFSIHGPADLFRRYFGAELDRTDDGVWTAGGTGELPIDRLPAGARRWVRGIVLEPPADLMELT